MEPLKHECGVALIRLRKPLSHFRAKYGTYSYALDKLYLMMEKQHNRGQEAAGVGVVKLEAPAGKEFIFRERALGKDAIPTIFSAIGDVIPHDVNTLSPETVESDVPFIGEVYMGHLRYSTTGKSGIAYAHPVLSRNSRPCKSLMLCGNFNLTNVEDLFRNVVAQGKHPRIYGDTNLILEEVAEALQCECDGLLSSAFRSEDSVSTNCEATTNLDFGKVLKDVAHHWDGGFVMCGANGEGNMFAIRDANGIRPAFYYADDEVIVLASERPVIQTVFDVSFDDVKELSPGNALIINTDGSFRIEEILRQCENRKCSFERIYFSRGSDKDIYEERKALGATLAPVLLNMIENDVENTVFSFIPNTAEVAFFGLINALEQRLDQLKFNKIKNLLAQNDYSEDELKKILSQRIRVEKVAIKDVKMRTFIAEGESRNDMVAHVYDITYGSVVANKDTLVVIDDSIVRGTTLTRSILHQLDRLSPKRIIVVSSSPQVRYPDYYGIDMSQLSQFIAFHAAIHLLRIGHMEEIIHSTYRKCLEQRKLPYASRKNCVKAIYAPFSESELSEAIVRLITESAPKPFKAKIDIVYQSIDGLHRAVPQHPGDWYFSGNYPTAGGIRLVNEAFISWYEKSYAKSILGH